ncbi:MAG TPA: nucleoside deaminase [Bacteroidales bacterium]|jgi:tRNA(Arg) A34 adenosine deaminase TadA|nr:nucleoside deaminase [Bacteroidales bacterium]
MIPENTNHEKFIRRVIEMAGANALSLTGGPFAAIVVRNGEVVGQGTNVVTTTNDPTAHAEVMAIRDACKNLGTFQLDGCDLYTSCEPCPMCLGAIYWARPARVYFAATQKEASAAGFDDSFIYQQIPLPYEQRSIQFINVKHQDLNKPFELWVVNDKKTEY